MSKPSFPWVAIENVKWHCIAVYCNFNHNEPFWGHYWGSYNARRCSIWCFVFLSISRPFSCISGGGNVISSHLIPLCDSRPGCVASLLLTILTRPWDSGGSERELERGNPEQQVCPTPCGFPLHPVAVDRLSCQASAPSTPSLAPKVSLSSSLIFHLDEGII